MIAGILPVLQTPFDENDRIAWDVLRGEIDWALDTGANGVCAAMVSEWLRLTHGERLEYMEVMADSVADRGTAIASVGAESTMEAVTYARAAERAGCHAVMAIPPVSCRLPESQVESYFSEIAESVSIPVMVQDASSYVGAPLSVALMARLLERFGPEKILFKPESSPVGPAVSELLEATGGAARVFDGSGGVLLVDTYRRGIVGTIPAVDLLDGIAALWQALKSGDERRIYAISLPLSALVTLQMQAGLDGFVAIEKMLLVERGVLPSARRRPPLAWELDNATRDEALRLFKLLQAAINVPSGRSD